MDSGCDVPVWKVFRQNFDRNGARQYWLLETQHDYLEEFAQALRDGPVIGQWLQTRKTAEGEYEITGRVEVLITLSAVHYIIAPINARYYDV